jgi:hypothetical protein
VAQRLSVRHYAATLTRPNRARNQLEAAYHKADHAIQQIFDLLAASGSVMLHRKCGSILIHDLRFKHLCFYAFSTYTYYASKKWPSGQQMSGSRTVQGQNLRTSHGMCLAARQARLVERTLRGSAGRQQL